MNRFFSCLALLVTFSACPSSDRCTPAPGAVGKACVAGSQTFAVRSAVAIEGQGFVGVILTSDALECAGAQTRASPAKAKDKFAAGSSRLELMVDLTEPRADQGHRYAVTSTDKSSTKGTSAGYAVVPKDGAKASSRIAQTGWIQLDEVGEQSVRGSYDVSFDGEGSALRLAGAFEARYCDLWGGP
ncbi:MAG: hypothetical protein QM765_40475 [Myxococcales bacterium]